MLPGEPWRARNVIPPIQPYGKLGYLWYGSPTALKLAEAGLDLVLGGHAAAEVAVARVENVCRWRTRAHGGSNRIEHGEQILLAWKGRKDHA
jgi:hypothetical protein